MGILLSLVGRVPSRWITTAGALRGRSAWFKRATDWLPALLRHREDRIQRGLGQGLRFNGANSAVGFLLGTHDPEVQFVLNRLLRPGMTVYDIGANVGFTAMLAAKCVAPMGRVLCFEPLAANAEQIRHNAQLNRFDCVEIRQTALGAADGEAEFFVSESPTWGRLAGTESAPLQSGVIRVPVRSLDSLAANDGLPPPHFIKMDVEGAEAGVIAGARALLAVAQPIMVIELHHTYTDVMYALDGLNYVVRPLTRDGEAVDKDGEFQILAYPRDRCDAEAVWADRVLGKSLENA
jgi:FkbM family methyltransferase